MFKKSFYLASCLIGLSAPLGVSLWAQTQEDIQKLQLQKEILQKDVANLDKTLNRTDSLAKAESERFELLKSRNLKDIQRREDELRNLQTKLAVVQSKISAERQKQAQFQNKVENEKQKRLYLLGVLGQESQKLIALVQKGLPWDLENRVARIQALEREIESKSTSLDEGFSRLTALINEEIKFGDEVILSTKPILRKNGETINAQVLRLGNQFMIYMDADQKFYGVLVPAQSTDKLNQSRFVWNENLDFKEREAVRAAIEIKQAKRPPQAVAIPLQIFLTSGVK